MSNPYKIQLGIDFDNGKKELKNIKNQLNRFTDNTHRIRVDIDNSRLLKQIEHAKKELKGLNGISGKDASLTINTKSLEDSFGRIESIIRGIQKSLGSLDDKMDAKNLVVSINQIASALDKATDESNGLLVSLQSIAKKDFNISIGLKLGNDPIGRNAAFGSKVRGEVLPQLKKEVASLVEQYNIQTGQSVDEYQAFLNLISKTKLGTADLLNGFILRSKDSLPSRMSGASSLTSQIDAYQEFIKIFREAAELKGVKLDNVVPSSDKLVKEAKDIQSGAKEAREGIEQLKNVFGTGSGIDTEGLSNVLEPIIQNVNKLGEFIDNLSKNNSIDELTGSFNRLAGTLENLMTNAKLIQDIFDNITFNNVGNNISNAVNQANKQNKKIISDSAQKSINNVSSKGINRYFEVSSSDSNAFRSEMDNLVKQWTNGKGNLVDLKIDTRTSYSKEEEKNIERLHQAQVTYNNALGETVKKTIAWRQIGTETSVVNGKEITTPIRGFVEVAGQYSKSLGQTKSQTNKFVKQQKTAVSNLTNQINQMNRAANDQNASRPIKLDYHLGSLADKYNEITEAIKRMENTSDTNTFEDERNNVKRLISEYKSLVSEYRNAENVSTKMKGTDFASGLDIAKNDLEKFKAEAKDFPQITKTINDLDEAINEVGDASSLNKFNDQLRVARSELSKIKSETAAVNRSKNVGIDTSGLHSQIEDLRRISPEIDNFETEIDGAKVTVKSLVNDLQQVKTASDFSVVNKRFNSFEKAAKAAGIAVTETAVKLRSIDDIKFNIDFGKYDNQVSRIYDNFNKLSITSKELEEAIEAVDVAYKEMLDASSANTGDEVADRERLIQAEKKYIEVLEKGNNLISIRYREEQAEAKKQKLVQDKESLKLDTVNWLNENTRAAKAYGDKLRELIYLIDQANDNAALQSVSRQIKNVKKEAQVMGKTGLTVFDKLKAKAKEYMTYLSAAEMFMYAEQAFRSMFEQVKLIDSAMTELKKVTNETDAAYDKFLTNAASRAKEIGTTIDGLVSSTADFARLGYGFEDAQGLAEVANIYAVVGDDIENVEQATESLISTLTAFKDEANGLSNSEFALSIVDKMNEVANNFAISSGGIGDALQRSASSMMAANNSLDETIALITAANTVVQDPEQVGTAFKTISMRIRGAKTELEEAGLETDGMVESTAKLREEVLALSGVDIMLNANEFKSTYQIMDELAEKWQDLTDIQQASVTELIAGKRQGNIVSSLMNNFDIAEEALQTSLNSSGSAMREHEKWQQSLEAQILKLKASWQALSQSFLSSDFLKAALDGIIGLVDGLTKLIDTFGAFPTLIGTVAAGFSLFKNKGLFTFDKDIQSIRLFGNELIGLKGQYTKIQTAIERYNSLSTKSASFQEKYNQSLAKSSTSMGKYLNGLNGAKASFSGYIGSLVGARLKTVALQAATMALNTALTMGVSAIISLISKGLDALIVTDEELAEVVDELTSKFREMQGELVKNKASFEAEAQLYAKLSRGVDELGNNVSLTADEYSEYKDIANSIADQVPSLVKGFDEQGNAILNCKDNVEELTSAYNDMIIAANQGMMAGGNAVFKDFQNKMEDINKTGWWSSLWNNNEDLTSTGYNALKNILDSDDLDDAIGKYAGTGRTSAIEILNELEKAGLEQKWDETSSDFIKRAITENRQIVESIVGDFKATLEENMEDIRTLTESYFSNAFLTDYSDISDFGQDIVNQMLPNLDSDFYSQFDDVNEMYDRFNEMLDSLRALDDGSGKEIESAFNLRTKFNGGEISYGEYVDGIEKVAKTINDSSLDEEIKNQIKLSLDIDEDGLVKEYQSLLNRLTETSKDEISSGNIIGLDKEKAEKFLNSLSSEELHVITQIIPELDANATIEQIQAAIDREMAVQGLTFDLNLEVETAGIESLNTALQESVSATGLSSESISALTSRYSDLEAEGYNLSDMFEETSNGIHLNKKAVSELEQAYAKQKQKEIKKDLESLKKEYDLLTKDIDNCTDAQKRASLYVQRDAILQQINDAATLAAQYDGLTSAYNNWLSAEEAGQERDMYEKVIEGFENIDDELSRGWLDDGSIKFLELLTGKTDLASKSGSELKKIYDDLDDTIKNTTYNVRDFFTVDEDGNSTNGGVYNFLDAVSQAFSGKDVVTKDDNGNIISFDFKLAGGDEAIAKALGISEELVQIMVRAADDAGFVVNIDGAYTQLADLKTEAEAARDSLISLKKEGNKTLKDVDVNFDFNAEGDDLVSEQEKAVKLLDKFKKDGKIDLKMDGAQEALDIAEYLTIKLDDLTEPRYMQIDTSTVEGELQEPIEKMQEFERLSKEKHLLTLTGDTKGLEDVEKQMDDIAKYLDKIEDEETQVKLGIKGLSQEEIKEKLEKGEIELDAEINVDLQMSDDLKDMRLMMMNQLGLVSDNEVKLKVGFDIDDSIVDGLTEEQQKVVVKYVVANEKEFKEYTEAEKETVVNLIANGVDLDSYEAEDKEAIVNYIANGKEADGWTPEAKEAFVRYLVDGGEPYKFDPEDKDSWVVYDTDTTKPDGYNPDDPTATVTYEKDTSDIDDYDPPNFIRKVVYKISTAGANAAAKGAKVLNDRFGIGGVDGTAHVDGTTGRAYKQGTWGTKGSGRALVGELGRETLVRNGRYYTIGDNGAEFIKYQKGDIIFNHKQTEELFKNGRVTSGGGRAEAFVDGTAFAAGTRGGGSNGSGGIGRAASHAISKATAKGKAKNTKISAQLASTKVSAETKTVTSLEATGPIEIENPHASSGTGDPIDDVGGTSVYDSGGGSGGGGSEDKFEESIDWVEVAINRIERAIDKLDQKANNVYKSWSDRNKALTSEIGKVGDEISLQQQAYDRYMQEANSVGLSESWAEKVRNGKIDIETITDEDLNNKISEYQTWYEKALACEDAIEDLKETESKLYAQRFENVQTQYEAILQGYEHTETMLNEYISQAEEQGFIISKKYYEALIENEKAGIEELKREQAELIAERDNAVAEGKIVKGSEEWYKQCAAIDEVTQSIEESTTALLEFDNSIRDIDWQIFDLIEERISAVTEEADFLIELMSNKKLFEDDGKLTSQGLATMALHGQNYNTYMYQADDYGAQVAELDKQIADDPYDQNLINRRNELLELQRESILAAEDEKEGIKSLIEEGIELELEALDERIQKYEEALDSQKD